MGFVEDVFTLVRGFDLIVAYDQMRQQIEEMVLEMKEIGV